MYIKSLACSTNEVQSSAGFFCLWCTVSNGSAWKSDYLLNILTMLCLLLCLLRLFLCC